MTPTETYLFLLTDSFITGLILPAKHSLVFTAMRIFGGYNLYLCGFIAAIGITIAAPLNWLFGRLLRLMKKPSLETKPNKHVDKVMVLLKKYAYWAGILGFVPALGPILIVFAGLVQTSLLRTTGLVFVSNFIFYGFLAYMAT